MEITKILRKEIIERSYRVYGSMHYN